VKNDVNSTEARLVLHRRSKFHKARGMVQGDGAGGWGRGTTKEKKEKKEEEKNGLN